MKVKKLGATEARNNFFEILTQVKHGGQVVKVYKNNKLMARIVGEDEEEVDWRAKLKSLKAEMPIFTGEDERTIEEVREKSKEKRFPEW